MKIEYQRAICVCEEKRRFRCRILIDDKEEVCYVPCSSRLSHYVEMENVDILVTKSKNIKSKLKYRLLAVKNSESWMLVDMLLLNQLVKEKYLREGFDVKAEVELDKQYKADFVINGSSPKIVEVKGILSAEEVANIPMFCGERAIRQLEYLSQLIKKKKYDVHYVFILMSEKIKKIQYNENEEKYKKLFRECSKNGMKVECYCAKIEADEIGIFFDGNIDLNI